MITDKFKSNKYAICYIEETLPQDDQIIMPSRLRFGFKIAKEDFKLVTDAIEDSHHLSLYSSILDDYIKTIDILLDCDRSFFAHVEAQALIEKYYYREQIHRINL